MKQIPKDILPILDNLEIAGNVVKITAQLNRQTYVKANEVLEALGGKWDRKAKGHVFQADPADILEEAVLTGEYSNKKQDFGFFETPPELAEKIVELADIKTGMDILEPSAGRGNLLKAIPEDLQPEVTVRAIDILGENVDVLLDAGFLYAGEGDFLNYDVCDIGLFDRIIMNPPFARQADIDHVVHAAKFLKPGGRLVAIMGSGIKFRENSKTRAFRDLVDRMGGQIIDNPDGSFKSSGTMVNTVTVVLNNQGGPSNA